MNGGYQLAVIGNAIATALPGKPDPIAMSAYFLSPGAPGPAYVDVDVRRDGRTVATVAADLVQGDATRITVLATYGDLGGRTATCATTAPEIDLPPLEECVPNTFAPPEFRKIAPLLDRFDMRFHPDQVGWAVGKPSGEGVLSAWFRLIDGREPDPLELLMVRRRAAAGDLRARHDGLGADPRADRARARPARAGLAEGAPPDPQRRGRDVRGGLRGLGLRGPAGRPVASARAGASLGRIGIATQPV